MTEDEELEFESNPQSCIECDTTVVFSPAFNEWVHEATYSVWCEGKAILAIPRKK